METEETRGEEGIFRKVTRDIDIEDSVRVEEQWDKVEKAKTEVAATVCGVRKGKYRQRETWWWCDGVEKAVDSGFCFLKIQIAMPLFHWELQEVCFQVQLLKK